jgi:hypothetical protein
VAGEANTRQQFILNDFRPGQATEEGPAALPPGAAIETFNTMPSASGALAVRPTVRQLDDLGFIFRPDVSHAIVTKSESGLADVVHIGFHATGASSFVGAWGEGVRADITAMNSAALKHDANRVWNPALGGRSINFPMVPGAFVTLHGQTVFITNKSFGRVGMVAGETGSSNVVLPYLHRIYFPLELNRDLTGCIAVAHHGRMFVAGNNSYPTKLRWSHVGEPCPEPSVAGDLASLRTAFDTAWPTTHFLFVDSDGSTNDPISGLVSYGNVLWVFTTDGVYQIAGADWETGEDIVIQRVPGAPGCVSPRTVYANESGIFYMSKTGPWRVDRSRADDISAHVSRDFDGLALGSAHAALTRQRYMVTLPRANTDLTYRNAINIYDSTRSFPSWHAGTGTPVPTKVTPNPDETGAEGNVGEFMRWQVNSVAADTSITPNTFVLAGSTDPVPNSVGFFVIPASTHVTLRFWVRRPPSGTAWAPASALAVSVTWLAENGFFHPDLGSGAFGGFDTENFTIGGNAVGEWHMVEFGADIAWTGAKSPPESMGIMIDIGFFGWANGSRIDLDHFELWPGDLKTSDGDVVVVPAPTDPLNPPDITYDKTMVFDIPSGGWAEWGLNPFDPGIEPWAYVRARPSADDSLNIVTGVAGLTGAPPPEPPEEDSWGELVTTPALDAVSWWRFTETSGDFADSIGTHPLTPSFNDPTHGAVGYIDKAADFSGDDDLYTMATTLRVPALTVQMWLKLRSYPTVNPGNYAYLMMLHDGSSSTQGWSLSVHDTGMLKLYRTNVAHTLILQTSTAFPLNAWTHLALAIDAGTSALYINGSLVQSAATGYLLNTGVSTAFNVFYGGPERPNGLLDELVFHDRILTAAEIAAFAAAPATRAGGTPPPDPGGGYWALEKRRFGGGDKEIVIDIEPALVPRKTPWHWTSGSLLPGTNPIHACQLIDSHLNVAAVGDAYPSNAQDDIVIASRWNGTIPDLPVATTAKVLHVPEGFSTERIRTGSLGRGQYPQIHLEGAASNELLIHAIDLEAEIDPRP